MRSNKHHTKDKGDIAVTAAIKDLTIKGYGVLSFTASEHYHFDLVAFDETKNKFYKIQCKYSFNGFINYKNCWKGKTGWSFRQYEERDFDYYAIYLPQIDTVIYPSFNFKGAKIRYTVPNSAKSFYWYEDFLDFTDVAKKKNYNDFGYKLIRNKKPKPQFRKVHRPEKEELEKLLWEKPCVQLAKDFGVSDKAIEKWAKLYNIKKPPRGYWQKEKWGK